MDIRNNQLVTTGNTTITALTVIDDSGYRENTWRTSALTTYLLEIVSGTVKFGVGGVASNSYANPVGAKVVITCRNGNLYCLQTSAGDTFRVTTCN